MAPAVSRIAPLRTGATRLGLGLLALMFCVAGNRARAVGPETVTSELRSGARLVVCEQHDLPIVLIRVLVDAGARLDPSGREGLASLTADLLTEGTTTRSAAQISESIDFVGGSLSSWGGTDYAQVSLRVLRKDLEIGLELLADVLLRPAFPSADLERRRESVLAAIRATRDNPVQIGLEAFRRNVFAGEPYGHPVEGDDESVRRITRADVRAFYARNYKAARSLIVVVGDLSAGEARRSLERVLSDWDEGEQRTFLYPTPGPARSRTVRIDMPVTQAAIVLGERGVARNNPDFETLQVMNYILGGGGFSARLTDSIRVRAGLAYSVGSYFVAYESTGSFQVSMQTKNASVGEAIERARRQLERIRDHLVSSEELDEAKRYLTGSFPLRFVTLGGTADFISQVVFYDLGNDYADRYLERVANVTREDVQSVARQYLHPDTLIEVVVADLDRLGATGHEP